MLDVAEIQTIEHDVVVIGAGGAGLRAAIECRALGLDTGVLSKSLDVDRVQEFRKCIECFLCQDVCHVVRDRGGAGQFVGPRFMIRLASLEMHPLDRADRVPAIRDEYGSAMCNITRCCTDVCPEGIQITDNGIIPLKERVVDRYYDPVLWLARRLFGRRGGHAPGGGRS